MDNPYSSFKLTRVRYSLEGHLAALNAHDISVQFFQGFVRVAPSALPAACMCVCSTALPRCGWPLPFSSRGAAVVAA